MYRAFEERRIQLANEGLATCPECADAYVLLVEHDQSRKEALRLYEQGVAAGERALGAETFHQNVGHFWAYSKPDRTCVPALNYSILVLPGAVVGLNQKCR